MSELSEKIKSEFDEPTKEAHAVLRKLLWVLYPTEETLSVDVEKTELDVMSDQNAAFIIDGLRLKGFVVKKLEQ